MFRIIIPLALLAVYWIGPLAVESVESQLTSSGQLEFKAKSYIQPTLDCLLNGDYSLGEQCRHADSPMMGLAFSAAAALAAVAAVFGVLGMLSFLSGIAGFFAILAGAAGLAATGWFSVDVMMSKADAVQLAWGAWASGGLALLLMLLGLVSMREE